MNLRKKQILAREFLILISVLLISLLAFLGSFGHNSYLQSRYEENQEKISDLKSAAAKLEQGYSSKWENQQKFYETVAQSDYEFLKPSEFYLQFHKLAKKNVLDSLWKTWEPWTKARYLQLGLNSPSELKIYIFKNLVTPADIKNREEGRELLKKTFSLKGEADTYLSQQLDYKQQKAIGLNTLYLLLFLAFGVRYLFYGIWSSVNVLKQKA